LAYDVQRDLAFYRLTVDFRNAVERMQLRLGRELGADHRWWGFGDLRSAPWPLDDDAGPAESRVPLHPPRDPGGAAVQLETPPGSEAATVPLDRSVRARVVPGDPAGGTDWAPGGGA
jgi:hypothetical protein